MPIGVKCCCFYNNFRFLSARGYASIPNSKYDSFYKQYTDRPEEFWAEQSEDLVRHKKWNRVLDNSNPHFAKWYVYF